MRGRVALLAACLLGSALPGAADEVGVALLVEPQVIAYPPRGESSYELKERNLIERGLKVQLLGPRPHLKIGLYRNFGCVEWKGPQIQSIGAVLEMKGSGELESGETAQPCAPTLKLKRGTFWLASLLRAALPIQLLTQAATIVVKGTVVRVFVDPEVGTFIAVDEVEEGTVVVQATAGGPEVQLAARQWVLVPPGGLPTRPAPLPPDDDIFSDPPLLPCCPRTEPPKPPPTR